MNHSLRIFKTNLPVLSIHMGNKLALIQVKSTSIMSKSRLLILAIVFSNPVIGYSQVLLDSIYSIYSNKYIEEQFVKIVWENSPVRKTNIKNSEILKSTIRSSRLSWLNGIFISTNINEFTIDPPANRNNFYPRYNFGYRLSYGDISGSVSNTKQGKLQLSNNDYLQEMDSIRIRSEFLRRFENLKYTEELLKLSGEKLTNINRELEIVEKEFSEGTKELSEYNRMLDLHRVAVAEEARVKHEHSTAIINVEEIIGISLEEAIHTIDLW